MRKIKEIIIHCSATRRGCNYDVSDIDRWHKQRGWNGCGYHFVVTLDGRIQAGRPLSVVGAHCQGHNRYSIGICYIGGLDEDGHSADTRTAAQIESLQLLIQVLFVRFGEIPVHGHNYYNPHKDCPCFDVTDILPVCCAATQP